MIERFGEEGLEIVPWSHSTGSLVYATTAVAPGSMGKVN